MALKLYYHPLSSYCQKALVALYENDIPFERKQLDALDHLFTPVCSIRRPTSARSCQCLPPSCHQPSTR